MYDQPADDVVQCYMCRGTGYIPAEEKKDGLGDDECPRCGGYGQVPWSCLNQEERDKQ